jgi:hypothetical protein
MITEAQSTLPDRVMGEEPGKGGERCDGVGEMAENEVGGFMNRMQEGGVPGSQAGRSIVIHVQ